MADNDGGVPPILAQKHYTQPSAFTPENLLREARRQKQITASRIPDICVLDPDGDIVRSLIARGERALRDEGTSYHYMAASDYSHADAILIMALNGAFEEFSVPVLTGATWTKDAPFRETQLAIEAMCKRDSDGS